MKRVDSFSDYLGGKFMSVADLQGKEWTLTIAETGIEEVPDFDHPGQIVEVPAIRFVEAKKMLRINQDRNDTLNAAFGFNQDNWIGKRVTLWPDMGVKFKNYVGSIRIRVDHSAQPDRSTPRQVPGPGNDANAYAVASQPAQPPQQGGTGSAALDDEIPFAPEWRG